MGMRVTPNLVKLRSGYGWIGGYYWHLKELMVQSGLFEVLGSGDGDARFAYSGVTAALPGAQQGSGGAYDCLMTPRYMHSSPLTPGAWNINGWVVMRQIGTGREYLLQNSSSTGGNEGITKIAYNPGGGATPAFVGSAASATAIPGAATNEIFLAGTRATFGQLLLNTTSGRVHVFCMDTPVNGVVGFGFIGVVSTGASHGLLAMPLVGTKSWELDPIAFTYNASNLNTDGMYHRFGLSGQAWVGIDWAHRNVYSGQFPRRLPNNKNPLRPIAAVHGNSPTRHVKGYLDGEHFAFSMLRGTYGHGLYVDAQGRRWYVVPGTNFAVRWSEDNNIAAPE